MTDDYRIYVDANWSATLNNGAGEAAGVAKGRAAAGQARKVLVDFAKQRAAEPNRVVAPLNNSREQLENGTSLQARDTAAAFRKEQAASRDVNASWQFPLATPTFATIN